MKALRIVRTSSGLALVGAATSPAGTHNPALTILARRHVLSVRSMALAAPEVTGMATATDRSHCRIVASQLL
jgi:hypothetical protein